MNRTAVACTSIATLGILGAAALVSAGPLDPPAGPVAPSYKTLTEVEPRIAISATNTPGDANSLYKITQPGSYYLTGNIAGVAGRHAIEIVASGVTLDLNGFDLVGVMGMGAFNGVAATVGSLSNVSVRNGSVRNWGAVGVDLGTVATATVVDVRAGGNTWTGIAVGVGGTISRCAAYRNTGAGISTGDGGTASGCSAYENAGNGFVIGSGSTVSTCTAYLNGSDGINTILGCTISACTAYSNGGEGISVANGSTISGCTAVVNQSHGIRISSDTLVIGSSCGGNGMGTSDGAGIHSAGGNNRIEGNICTAGDRGIQVAGTDNDIIGNSCAGNGIGYNISGTATGNFIARNTARGNNTNWSVIAGNVIFVVEATTAGIVVGNSGGVSPGSTNPNANFSY